MSNKYQTEQEEFWAGDFGLDYMKRNTGKELLATNISLFSKIINKTKTVDSVLELGANIGLNLEAINALLPNAKLSAVEINDSAAKSLQSKGIANVYVESIINFSTNEKYDLVLIKGVLIHMDPSVLQQIYQTMHSVTKKYICIVEYYNPQPVAINYRGHQNKLFKRDFCGELMDAYSDLVLVDYGFVYYRDNNFPADDLTWFLLEKK